MKKTLFITMLAAALMGGQVFAEDAIPTAVEGYTYKSGYNYMGVRNTSGDASGGNVTVSYSETGSDYSKAKVYGGYSTTAAASNNIVTMTGGQVNKLYGGQGKQAASGNTAIMTGGQVDELYGGQSSATKTGVASGNVAIVAGDCIVSSFLYGGGAEMGAAANDNKIYLVGKGATATIADAQGKTATYTGGAISVNNNIRGGHCVNTSTGNSLDIYGTGITASGGVSMVQILNFHIAGALALADAPMITSTYARSLNLTGVTLGFCSDDVQDWSAFDGKSITLVDTTSGITIDEGSLGDVEIKDANGLTVATATLALGGSDDVLSLSNIKGVTPVPEPTTGTLSLLALAGLCIRRRRK